MYFARLFDAEKALVMALLQKPIHGQCFGDVADEPAWKIRPSWYQISLQNHMIPAETEKEMAQHLQPRKIISLDAGHASLASHPEEVTQLILEAASSL